MKPSIPSTSNTGTIPGMSSSALHNDNNNDKPNRGTFIVLEGVDRCGKTTQVNLLVKHMIQYLGLSAIAMQFPNRTTYVGNLIDQYSQSKTEIDDHAIHLLFSANRWENVATLRSTLLDDKTSVVCDRYAYSGVAFSSAKTTLENDLEWCKSCDIGLPAPDAVIFLDLTQEQAQQRGGYGEERYEKKEMQIRVRQKFQQLQSMDEIEGQVPWYVVDASKSIDQVQNEINTIVKTISMQVQHENKPLGVLWKKDNGISSNNGKENKEN